MLFCFLRLYWVFIKSECLDVGSGKYLSAVNQPAIILIFKNIAFFRNCLLCLFWASFWLRDFGLFVVVVFVIDFTIDWWDGLSCLFWRFVFWMFLIEWLRGLFFLIVWFDWLFRLVVFCWVVVILWERRKIMVGRCIAMLPLLNPVSKWVRSDSNGWSFDLGVYCLLWKRFCVLNVALRMTKKLNRLRNSDGYVLVFKKTQRVVWPCFYCVDFMAQTVAAYSSAHKWFWLKKNNHRNAPWKMTDTDWTKSLSF